MSDKFAGLTQAQLDSHWMAFSANRQFKKDPRIIVAADGAYYTDAEGRKIFDGLSGLWTCGLGHNVPQINEAVSNQMKELDYSPAFQFGHVKSFQLAERITEFMPEGLNRVFFTNSGSEAVETSLKIARAYWRKMGQPSKTRLIGRAKGYHGVNFGGISVGESVQTGQCSVRPWLQTTSDTPCCRRMHSLKACRKPAPNWQMIYWN